MLNGKLNGKWLLCSEYLKKIEPLSLARIQRNTGSWKEPKKAYLLIKWKQNNKKIHAQEWVLRTCSMSFPVYQSTCSPLQRKLQMFWLRTVLMLFFLVHLILKKHVTLVFYTLTQDFRQIIIASRADQHLDSACGTILSETLTYSVGVL